MKLALEAPATPTLAVADRDERFPVHRVYCVGRNYAAHAREMGKDPDREPPFFFMKPAVVAGTTFRCRRPLTMSMAMRSAWT
jgi:fumarylpyruvate hydrolase